MCLILIQSILLLVQWFACHSNTIAEQIYVLDGIVRKNDLVQLYWNIVANYIIKVFLVLGIVFFLKKGMAKYGTYQIIIPFAVIHTVFKKACALHVDGPNGQ